MKITSCTSQKTLAITFTSVFCVFGRFGAISLLTVLTLHVISEHSGGSMFHPSSQIDAKILSDWVKIGPILLRSGHTNAFLVDCDQLRHSSCTSG